MPGDTIHSRAGVVHINGAPQQGYGVAAADGAPGNETHPLFDWQRRVQLLRLYRQRSYLLRLPKEQETPILKQTALQTGSQ
jgi:hypothetical protein